MSTSFSFIAIFFYFYKIVISSFNVILSNACYSCYQANIASDVLPLIYFQVWSITRVKGARQIRAAASVFPQDRRRNPFRCLLPCQCHHSSSQICETFYGNLIKISSNTCHKALQPLHSLYSLDGIMALWKVWERIKPLFSGCKTRYLSIGTSAPDV